MRPIRRAVSARAARALHPIRNRYQPADTAIKLAVLREIAAHGVRVRTCAELLAVHGDLLFLRAFPDSVDVFAAAGVALRRIEPALKQLSARQRALADESGMIGSVTHYTPSYDIARWLVARWPLQADINWAAYEDETKLDTLLRPLLRPLLQRGEEDGFEGGAVGTREWVDLTRDASTEGTLAWLMSGADHSRARGRTFQSMYHEASLPVRNQCVRSPRRWTGSERLTSKDGARVVERRALATMMRAKGGAQEATFVELAQAHPRFFPELIRRVRLAR